MSFYGKICFKSYQDGRRLALYSEGSDPPIHMNLKRFGKEGMLMSDFELLSIVLMILAIIVTLIIALINAKK